ncbi:MAG: integrase [Candidatus Melainabacteria bacterium]|nr:MAG: integrase [Candidatus Melainabacteria bacterium]
MRLDGVIVVKKKKLTNTLVSSLPYPAKGEQQKYYWDADLPGFGVRVSPGTKTFFCESRVAGKTVRTSLGNTKILSAEEARKRAKATLGQMASGLNPNAQKKDEKAKSITLREAWLKLKESRQHLYSPATVKVYEWALSLCFPDWLDKSIVLITKDMIEKRHRMISERVGPHSAADGSKALANQGMRVLRTIFNFAIDTYEDSEGRSLIPQNPVRRLKGQWNRIDSRHGCLRKDELKPWLDAVEKLSSDAIRDHLILCLFTGLRRNEAAKLRWDEVDLKRGTLTFASSRMKNNQPHQIPVSDYILELLKRRDVAKKTDAIYVFPGQRGNSGHMIENMASVRKVRDLSKVNFTTHDLRRTFLTFGEQLGIERPTLKRLASHTVGADITERYIQAETERLRIPVQLIADYILEASERRPAKKNTVRTKTSRRTASGDKLVAL